MALKIRLARGGSKKRPHYSIVVADGRAARDGKFIEKIGTYNPMLPRESEQRVSVNVERAKYWLSVGAQASDRTAQFLANAGLMEPRAYTTKPQKSAPRKKAQERMKEEAALAEKQAEAAKAAEEAAKAEAEKPAEAPAEEAPAATEEAAPEAPAEAAPSEEETAA